MNTILLCVNYPLINDVGFLWQIREVIWALIGLLIGFLVGMYIGYSVGLTAIELAE